MVTLGYNMKVQLPILLPKSKFTTVHLYFVLFWLIYLRVLNLKFTCCSKSPKKGTLKYVWVSSHLLEISFLFSFNSSLLIFSSPSSCSKINFAAGIFVHTFFMQKIKFLPFSIRNWTFSWIPSRSTPESERNGTDGNLVCRMESRTLIFFYQLIVLFSNFNSWDILIINFMISLTCAH